jgi:hypothetical protein
MVQFFRYNGSFIWVRLFSVLGLHLIVWLKTSAYIHMGLLVGLIGRASPTGW